jgi:dihydrofolate reductase
LEVIYDISYSYCFKKKDLTTGKKVIMGRKSFEEKNKKRYQELT